ncbi:MAG: hypothetical protein A3C53_04115 [Omnitrophica WOR_2 bacterium RIFCSPHIGHO2_02_FULL_68_15]|nr:MAG: hypothetical protein A3C53_04115 [Omnitrophica WOR_2 bacterium RIFCSPHIGHO2_02_FULL_68_15]
MRGIYENGTIRFPRTVVRLGKHLPLPNRSRLSFTIVFPAKPSVAAQTFGILRAPKRIARLIAESPELSLWNS